MRWLSKLNNRDLLPSSASTLAARLDIVTTRGRITRIPVLFGVIKNDHCPTTNLMAGS
jgi:hypothetical protein